MLGNSVRDVQRCLTQPKRASSTGTPRARMRPPTTTKRGRCEFNWTLCIRRVRERGSHLLAGGGRRAVIQRACAPYHDVASEGSHRQLGGRGTPGCAGGNGRHPRSTGRQLHAVHKARHCRRHPVHAERRTLETFRFTDKNGTQWSVPTNIGRLSNVDRQRPNSFIRVGKRYFVHAQVCGSGGNASLISMYDAAVNFGPVR